MSKFSLLFVALAVIALSEAGKYSKYLKPGKLAKCDADDDCKRHQCCVIGDQYKMNKIVYGRCLPRLEEDESCDPNYPCGCEKGHACLPKKSSKFFGLMNLETYKCREVDGSGMLVDDDF